MPRARGDRRRGRARRARRTSGPWFRGEGRDDGGCEVARYALEDAKPGEPRARGTLSWHTILAGARANRRAMWFYLVGRHLRAIVADRPGTVVTERRAPAPAVRSLPTLRTARRTHLSESRRRSQPPSEPKPYPSREGTACSTPALDARLLRLFVFFTSFFTWRDRRRPWTRNPPRLSRSPRDRPPPQPPGW